MSSYIVMNRYRSVLVAAVVLTGNASAIAGDLPAIPRAAMPTVECIHRVLKSSSAVQSVDLYSIDGYRFAVEFVFRNKDNRAVTSDIEFFIDADGSVTEIDKVPREVSAETANEAQDLESKLDVDGKCHMDATMDNVLPPQGPRTDWRKLDWTGREL